jgi:hypothetical protein
LQPESRLESGSAESGWSCLLFVVVRMRGERSAERENGRRRLRRSESSAIVEEAESEMERVGGSERPGNEESKTLTVCAAMVAGDCSEWLLGTVTLRV